MMMTIGVKLMNAPRECQTLYYNNQKSVAQNGDNIISFALGEGNKPLGIFMDKEDSEFLSFLTISGRKR